MEGEKYMLSPSIVIISRQSLVAFTRCCASCTPSSCFASPLPAAFGVMVFVLNSASVYARSAAHGAYRSACRPRTALARHQSRTVFTAGGSLERRERHPVWHGTLAVQTDDAWTGTVPLKLGFFGFGRSAAHVSVATRATHDGHP